MQKINLPDGLGLRLARPSDKVFIESLFNSTREFLYLADAEKEYIDMLREQQFALQSDGYGQNRPDALTFIIEKQGTSIGRLILDFGKNIAHVIDLALIKEARGKGYGKSVLQAVQHIASQQTLPVGLTVSKQDLIAKRLYLTLGFQTTEMTDVHEFMMWYPSKSSIQV